MNKRKVLGQFYTPDQIASTLVREALSNIHKKKIKAIELSAGEGHLLDELEKKSKTCELYAVDIDEKNSILLRHKFPNAKIYNEDGVGPLEEFMDGSFDLAIGNPPFLKYRNLDSFSEQLIDKYLDIKAVDYAGKSAEVVFMAQYLRLLKKGGILSIILPDSIISGVHYSGFRAKLLKMYDVISIIEVNNNTFVKTEAKTHIITIKNTRPKSKVVNIKTINNLGKCTESIDILKEQLINRMDYSYHIADLMLFEYRVSEYAEVYRGKYTHKELKENKSEYLHTTNFNKVPIIEDITCSNVEESHYAKSGDILMCRVGSRVVGNVMKYHGPKVLVSDCIFIIRFSEQEKRDQFFEVYKKRDSLNRFTRGVCSRYITKKDVLSLSF
jgi:type I restriction-modification system DNA methylase subunit